MPATFAHDARVVAIALLPLLVLFDFAGEMLQGAAAAGLLGGYLLHALGLDEGCFVLVWVVVLFEAIGQLACAFSAFGFSVRAVGLAILGSLQMSLLGVWLSLRFVWLAEQHPDSAALFERLLFNLLPLPSAAVFTWGVGAAWGADVTPYALLLSLGAAHLLLGTPTSTSFPAAIGAEHVGTGADRDVPPRWSRPASDARRHGIHAGDASAARAHAACLVLLPSMYYAVLHSPTLLTAWADHLAALRTLVCAGALAVAVAPPACTHGSDAAPSAADGTGSPDNLRLAGAAGGTEVGEEESTPGRGAQSVAAVSLVGLACAAHANIVRSATEGGSLALLLVIRPPYGGALLAVALGSPVGLLLVGLATRGRPPPALVPALSAASLVSLTMLLGLPSIYLLAALAAALGGAYAHAARSSSGVGLCAIGATALAHGVLHRTTGFISHIFLSTNLSLGTIAVALVAMTGLAAVSSGLSLLRAHHELSCGALLVHALLLASVEIALLEETMDDGTAVYPAPLLAATVIGGVVLCERLRSGSGAVECEHTRHGARPGDSATGPGRSSTTWWLLLSAHAGRLALFIDASPWAYLDGALLVAALTQRLHSSSTGWPRRITAHGHTSELDATLAVRVALLVLAIQRAHGGLLPQLLAHLGIAAGRSPPVLLGIALSLCAGGAHLLLSDRMPTPTSRAMVARLCAWLFAAGAVFVTLQPVLDVPLLIESVLWTLFHPTASLTFGGTPRLLLWPPWLLAVLVLAGLALLLGIVPVAVLSPPVRLGACALTGAGAALTAAGSVLPLERSLYLLLAAASAVAGAFLGIVTFPRGLVRSPRVPGLLLAIFFTLFPTGLLAIGHAFRHSAVARTFGAAALYRASWCALFAGVAGVGALLCRVHSDAALSDAAVVRGSPSKPLSPIGGGGGSSVALRAEAYEHRQAARRAGLEWLGGVGNVCALAALALCLGINLALLEGSARGVVPTAPLLLLLHPHTPPASALNASNRYAPVGSAIVIALAVAAVLEVAERFRDHGVSVIALRGAVLVACTAPSLLLCTKFMWDRKQASSATLTWCLTPLNLVPMLLSHSRQLYDLGGAGLVAGIVHVAMARHARKVDAKYV